MRVISCSLPAMQAAIDRMPYEEKAVYLEAKKVAPEVVARESEMRRFLLCEDGDVDKAARRLVSYWDYRKELFGDRAFKPMLLTGTGVLSDEDIEILMTGAVAILPPDLDGRPVVYLERDLMTPEQMKDEMSRSRCFFYILHLVCLNDSAQTQGIVCLASVANKHNAPTLETTFNKHSNNFSHILPMKVACTHLLAVSSNSALKIIIDGLMAIGLRMAAYRTKYPIESHRGTSGEEVFKKLQKHRLPKRCVPDQYGGSWTLEKFKKWHRKQLKIEKKNFLTDEERLNLKRKVNVIHSRQKRIRRKVEHEVLDDRADAIRTVNERLELKNIALESLLLSAKECVRAHEDEMAAAQAKRNPQQPAELQARVAQPITGGVQARVDDTSTILNYVTAIHAASSAPQPISQPGLLGSPYDLSTTLNDRIRLELLAVLTSPQSTSLLPPRQLSSLEIQLLLAREAESTRLNQRYLEVARATARRQEDSNLSQYSGLGW